MLITATHAEIDENHPNRLVFRVVPYSIRQRLEHRRLKFIGQVEGIRKYSQSRENMDPWEPEPLMYRIEPGARGYAGLPRGDGRIYQLLFKSPVRSGVLVLFSPGSTIIRDSHIPISISHRLTSREMADTQAQASGLSLSPVLCTDVRFQDVHILYVTPESLKIRGFEQDFFDILHAVGVRAVLINEVHCLSQWERDFIPAYTRLSAIVQQLDAQYPQVPIIGLTGCGPGLYQKDVESKLGLIHIGDDSHGYRFRPHVGCQVVSVNPGEKVRVSQRILHELIPAALGKESLEEVFEASDGTQSAFCIYADESAGSDLEDRIAGFLRDPQHPNEPDTSTDDSSSNTISSKRIDTDTDIPFPSMIGPKGFPEPLIAQEMVQSMPLRFVIHMSMPKSIESWYQEISLAGRGGRAAHCVQVVDLPEMPCEKDMCHRAGFTPACALNQEFRCEFDRPGLCDYGRRYRHFTRHFHQLVAETCETIRMLDTLMVHWKASSPTIQISAGYENQAIMEQSLYDLAVLGVIDTYYLMETSEYAYFEIDGFHGSLDIRALMNRLLAWLRQNDISMTRAYQSLSVSDLDSQQGLVAQVWEQFGSDIQEQLQKTLGFDQVDDKSQNKVDYLRVAQAVAVMRWHVRAAVYAMQAYRLWNVKELIREPQCRNAGIRMYFEPTDETYRCHRCDICVPDLKFSDPDESAEPDIPDIPGIQTLFDHLFDLRNTSFDLDMAAEMSERLVAYPRNCRIQANRILEKFPRNIHALYLLRDVCQTEARSIHGAQLMRIVSTDLDAETIMKIYEMFSNNPEMQWILMDILDNEFCRMHSQQGEQWLYQACRNLADGSGRLQFLAARLMINHLHRMDLSGPRFRLRRLIKELESGSFVRS